MSLIQTMVSGLRAVGGNRMRSLLTSLGILIGVCALIVTVGIGTGARASIGSHDSTRSPRDAASRADTRCTPSNAGASSSGSASPPR